MNSFVVALYDLAAAGGALLLVHVIRQAMSDLHLNRTDPPWVIRQRKYAFFTDAAFLFLSICFQDFWLVHPTVVAVGLYATGLVSCGAWILVVNVISLDLRNPRSGPRSRMVSIAMKTSRIFTKIVR